MVGVKEDSPLRNNVTWLGSYCACFTRDEPIYPSSAGILSWITYPIQQKTRDPKPPCRWLAQRQNATEFHSSLRKPWRKRRRRRQRSRPASRGRRASRGSWPGWTRVPATSPSRRPTAPEAASTPAARTWTPTPRNRRRPRRWVGNTGCPIHLVWHLGGNSIGIFGRLNHGLNHLGHDLGGQKFQLNCHPGLGWMFPMLPYCPANCGQWNNQNQSHRSRSRWDTQYLPVSVNSKALRFSD